MTETKSETKKNKKTYLKRAAAVASMLAIVLSAVSFMSYYLCIPISSDVTRVIQFGKEPENSIDVLLLGSSQTYSGFSSAYAYGKFGYTSYPLVISGSSCTAWKPAVRKALWTQKPKLIVVDTFGGGYDAETVRSRKYPLYMLTNYTPLSWERMETAYEMSVRSDESDALSYAFPFIRYHTKVPASLLTLRERIAIDSYGPSPLKGVETITAAEEFKPLDEKCFTDDKIPLDTNTEEIITDFIDFCSDKDIPVLFVKYPSVMRYEKDFEANERMNSVLELAESKGCATLDLEKRFSEIGLDEASDYYNRSHPNVRGQKKITEYLGSYIQNEMGIGPSELDASLSEDWDRASAYYEVFCDIAEEMIADGKSSLLSDSPGMLETISERANDR